MIRIFITITLACSLSRVCPQTKKQANQLVYVDRNGTLRYTKDKTEAAFFGVNYTVPFAYGYRSVLRTGVTAQRAIDQDVYHLSRLGLDAFRVHVWDTEISDKEGNLLTNEHLRLFDYLVFKLKEKNIRIMITPIAFWGNGYPEKDENTGSFSNVYGKQQSVVNEDAIKAQERYLQQLFTHINPFTNLAYKDDINIIAAELNNEPHHSGPKEKTTEYINRLAVALRSTGWAKPVFYNISESPTYADAVVKANVEGHSFQWYPTGLVASHILEGNYLPNVDRYLIPFDSIAGFKKRAKMVYEFDAGDVLQPVMYPAMARSFRTAGFQWATQFAYDPMATAYANTEYQTHYLNLAYTPSKAISLMIACKAFHKLPRFQSYGAYPADSVFDVFRVSYKEQLSEMNTPEAFYYSNSTASEPVNVKSLQHIAGVGTSPVVTYYGSGAYFLDKLDEGRWRLEIMPDAITVSDPFKKASPSKTVTSIKCSTLVMQLKLPDLGAAFSITAIDSGNKFSTVAAGGSFDCRPGTYILSKYPKQVNQNSYPATVRAFAAPVADTIVSVVHQPFYEVSADRPFTIETTVLGLTGNDKVILELHSSSGQWKTLQMQPVRHYYFSAEVPKEMAAPGMINYRIIFLRGDSTYFVYPGNHRGDPYAWDAYKNETWQTFVAINNAPLVLFNANYDRDKLAIYNTNWRTNSLGYVTAEKPGQLILKATIGDTLGAGQMAWQQFIGDKLSGRETELALFQKLRVRAGASLPDNVPVKVGLMCKDGSTFTAVITPKEKVEDIDIPLSSFKPDSLLLLPRPYPGFQPLMFYHNSQKVVDVKELDKIQISFAANHNASKEPVSIEIESISLEKENKER